MSDTQSVKYSVLFYLQEQGGLKTAEQIYAHLKEKNPKLTMPQVKDAIQKCLDEKLVTSGPAHTFGITKNGDMWLRVELEG